MFPLRKPTIEFEDDLAGGKAPFQEEVREKYRRIIFQAIPALPFWCNIKVVKDLNAEEDEPTDVEKGLTLVISLSDNNWELTPEQLQEHWYLTLAGSMGAVSPDSHEIGFVVEVDTVYTNNSCYYYQDSFAYIYSAADFIQFLRTGEPSFSEDPLVRLEQSLSTGFVSAHTFNNAVLQAHVQAYAQWGKFASVSRVAWLLEVIPQVNLSGMLVRLTSR